jgi:hypothetical protein
MTMKEYNEKLEQFTTAALQGILANDRAHYTNPEAQVERAILYAKEIINQLEPEYKSWASL